MTREEAANIIKKCKEKGFKYTFYTLNDYHTALDMAIKALEQMEVIEAIIKSPIDIQEDVLIYKMICELVEKALREVEE